MKIILRDLLRHKILKAKEGTEERERLRELYSKWCLSKELECDRKDFDFPV